MSRLVVGVGNSYRRDDGVGLAVAEEIAKRALPDVRVVTAIGEPGAILDAWNGVSVAVVVDAALGEGATPGRIRRWTPGDLDGPALVSSHALGLPQTYALGHVLGQLPDRLVVFTIEASDVDHGLGLTPAVAAAVPEVVDAILAEFAR
ncbi:MAG TPA: hydrogenase maturation protease [Mycobacterium sp.]|nr:hydrogenase maturation protease [Mycobacterium sp.]